MSTGLFPAVKGPGHGVHHAPTSSAEVKEKVEPYLNPVSGLSWPVLEWKYLDSIKIYSIFLRALLIFWSVNKSGYSQYFSPYLRSKCLTMHDVGVPVSAASFRSDELCFLFTRCICGFRMILIVTSFAMPDTINLFVCEIEMKCFLWSVSWIYKHNLYRVTKATVWKA
jgi:hypothetical protein